jgi:glycine oxidase
MRVSVIGAGVVGLATALECLQRGAEVTLIERRASLGGNASWLAGGMLAPDCEGESAPASVAAQGFQAVEWWARHVPDVQRNGSLVVAPARDAADVERFARRTQNFERVDEARIAELEPDLAGRFRKGLFYPKEGHVDARRAMAALLESLVAGGAEVRFGVEVAPPLPLAGEGWGEGRAELPSSGPSGHRLPQAGEGITLDCRGFAAHAELPDLRPVRGEMVIVRTSEISLKRPVRMLHPRIPLYVVPRKNNVFMIGATMIESADASAVSVRSALELLGAAYALHPAFAEAEVLEMSAALRPAFPDNEPRILAKEGRIYVNGFFRHGFLLAPWFAARAAEMALRRAA